MSFPLPLLLPVMWRGGRSESLPLPLSLGVLVGAPMACGNDGKSVSYCWEESEGLLPGCAAAFGGGTRTDLKSGSGDIRIAWPGVGRASWIRSCGIWTDYFFATFHHSFRK